MRSFTCTLSPGRVIFGENAIQRLPNEVQRLGKNMPLILASKRLSTQIGHIRALLEEESLKIAGVFHDAMMHTPTNITRRAVEYSKTTSADCIISMGGGSAIGLGKAIALQTGLSHICLPTTYAGSEMTAVLGETTAGIKTTRTDPTIVPNVVIYDPKLTLTMSTAQSGLSGINAMAHAIEAMYTTSSNPVIKLIAKEGVKVLVDSLPKIQHLPNDISARHEALYGAWLCSICLGSVGMALHHKLCHVLAGSFNLPHAETHAIVLPHALSYNAGKIPNVMQELADIFPNSSGDAVKGLEAFLVLLGLGGGLCQYGMCKEDIQKAVDLALAQPYWNPRALDYPSMHELIRRCWAGEAPRANL